MNTVDLVEWHKSYTYTNLDNLPNELWLDIDGFDGQYKISNLGRVKRMWKYHYSYFAGGMVISNKPKILKGSSHLGYRRVSLIKDGIEVRRMVHNLVANAFIPNPYNLNTVDHKSMVKTQNNVDNLRWVTRSENVIMANELGVFGNQFLPKFTQDQVVSIFKDERDVDVIAKDNNVHKTTIYNIKKGKSYSRFTIKNNNYGTV